MISKQIIKLFIVALATLLAACNQMAPSPVLPLKTQEIEEPAKDNAKKQVDNSETAEIGTDLAANEQEQEDKTDPQLENVVKLPPEEIKAYALLSMSDQYQMTKTQLSPEVAETVKAALQQFHQGQLEQSQRTINQLIANELYLSSAVYVLAGDIALARAKELNENEQETATISAILQYEKALKLNSYNARAANRLAKIMREKGQFERALSLYSQAIDAQPAYANSYRNRAILHDIYLHNKTQALADYENYQVLLMAQSRQLESGELTMGEKQSKVLKTNLKLVKRWLIDLERQIQLEAKQQMQSQTTQESL